MLDFTGVAFFDNQPNKVERADADMMPGFVLSNGIDANGRLIGFVCTGEPLGPDGGTLFLDEEGVDRSANARLLAAGHVYPAFYSTLPASLRTHLGDVSRQAREEKLGLWPRATGDRGSAATVDGLAGLQELVLWPKLFRRLVPFLATGAPSLDGFDAWLRQDPVNRDDALFLLERGEAGNLHDVITAAGREIALNAWPEDFIIGPDPAPPVPPQPPARPATGDVLIVAARPGRLYTRSSQGGPHHSLRPLASLPAAAR
jgi:hypothetical protein